MCFLFYFLLFSPYFFRVQLWNNDWVADVNKQDFPQYKICTDWIRNHYTLVIDIDEVTLFEMY